MKQLRLWPDIISLHSIKTVLLNGKETLAIVENNSTGGLLQATLALAEQSEEFYTGGMVINNFSRTKSFKSVVLLNDITIIANKFAYDIARKFNSDWGIAIIGDDTVSQSYSGKSWLSIQHKNILLVSMAISLPRNGLRTPDVIVQKTIRHFLKLLLQ